MTFKVTKPKVFDGSDTSIANVNAWSFSVKEYMDLAEVPADKQIRAAAMLLDGTPKTWYINTYENDRPRRCRCPRSRRNHTPRHSAFS